MKLKPVSATLKRKQTGVALIVVMLIVALVTVLAVEMSSRLQLNVARTLNLKANNQAYWYALGAEQFAQKSLATLQTLTEDNINLSQPWAQPFEYPVDGGSIKAELVDMQSCFNLNAVNSALENNQQQQSSQDENQQQSNSNDNENEKPQTVQSNKQEKSKVTASQTAFHKLLENFIQDTLITDTIRDSLVDWIDDDSTPSNYGAEDADYESLPFPYLAANNPLSHPSELRLINGIDEAIRIGSFKELRNVVCVLPERHLKINVNTITQDNAVVLSALLGDTLDSGISIVNSRPEQGYKSKEDFLALPEVKALELSPEQQQWFDVTTKYFRLKTTAKFQGSQFRLSTIFRLDDDGITIVSREFGGAL